MKTYRVTLTGSEDGVITHQHAQVQGMNRDDALRRAARLCFFRPVDVVLSVSTSEVES